MDELFKKALTFVLKWEGGFVDDPDDRGGATNKGITQNTYNAYLKTIGQSSKPVKNITQSEVEAIYYQRYWLAAKCNTMSKQFAVLSFDTAVNMGVKRVSEFMKAAEYKDIDKFINARETKYNEFANAITGYVLDKTTGKKIPQYSQRKFLKGWLNRLNALKTFVKTI